ncbi:MAG: SnoaL-like domain-containing protein [Gemmatimonadetes bacterium]|nr:SnoaL-like domain-containing protein [Gemmatimonadota bacterium]
MRVLRLRFGCLLSLVLLAGCQAQGSYTQADLGAAEAAVQGELDRFWSAWEAADIDTGMSFYSDSPDGSFINDGVIWESTAAAMEAYGPFFETVERQEFDVFENRILAVKPDVVLVTIGMNYRQVLKTGETTPATTVGFTMLWVKEGSEWKSLAYNFSTTNPVPATMKSVHLLEAPSAADEAAYAGALRGMNTAIREAGFLGNGYDLWKVGGVQDSEYDPIGTPLILEGSWTDQETYDLVHALEVYSALDQETLDLFDRVAGAQRYTRYVRVPVGGPGEG